MSEEPTSLRMTITLPNGTVQDFAIDAPPAVALEAFRLFLGAPAAGVLAARADHVAVASDIPAPALRRLAERRRQCEAIIVGLAEQGPVKRATVIDRMRMSGWLEHQVRDAIVRLRDQGVIVVDPAPGGRDSSLLRLATSMQERASA